jgi:hypothetical protein
MRYSQSSGVPRLTIDIQLVQLSIDRSFGIMELRLNGIYQSGLLEVEIGGEVDNVKFHRLSIGLIENILLVDTEGGGIAGSRKMLQLGLRSLGKIDPSV